MRLQCLIYFLWASTILFAQNPDYDFYSEFRAWVQQLVRTERFLKFDQVMERYGQKLQSDGISVGEIQRRENLIRNSRNGLENDFWNRFFAHGKGVYNAAPNAFLTEVVEGRKPGTALDCGMGEGRNAIFLAKLGWQVSGFDPAGEAVALAKKRAQELGLKLDTALVRDSEYEFGKDRFDLVLFSWVLPKAEYAEKVADSLKPGGIVVVECGADWFARNGIFKVFDKLQIVRYEIVTAKSDFFHREEMEILRLVARKPAP